MIRLNERLKRMREEDGFTLIELMVVVLIIAILIAIAIPTFLGARRRAQDRAAQSSLRNTVTGAKAIFTDRETYSDAVATALASGEPALTFNNGTASTGQNIISVSPYANASATEFHAAAFSKSGTCWFVRDAVDPNSNAGTGWAKDEDASGNCDAAAARGIADANYNKEPASAPES